MADERRHLFDLPAFLEVADRIAHTFVERTGPMLELVDSSILFSDGLCVCALCESYSVDYLVESGTGFGGSTEMFARYFDGHERLQKVWSIDLVDHPVRRWLDRFGIPPPDPHLWSAQRGARQVAKDRLSPFTDVELAHGDAVKVLPDLVAELVEQEARVGTLIDGPKEAKRLSLAHRLLAISPNVCFAALDDIGPMFDDSGRHARFLTSPYAAFFTRFSWVNRGRPPTACGIALSTPATGSASLSIASPSRRDRFAGAEAERVVFPAVPVPCCATRGYSR